VAVHIRLRRTGAKKQPSYRLVVADSRSPRDGRFLAIVGHYNPRSTPADLVLDDEKISTWLKNGARPTVAVARLLVSRGLYDASKVKQRRPRSARKAKAAAAAS
jgi:small subunit ribosomal protein S16